MLKSRVNVLWKILVSPPVIVFAASMVFLFFGLWATYSVRPFNSDDVTWQNILITWKPFSGHQATLGSSDGFVDKVPFYVLINHFFGPSRKLLFVESYAVEVIGFSLFYVTGLYFLRKQGSKLTYLSLLPFLWLSSFGYAFAQMYLISDWRGAELGISFVTFLAAAVLLKEKYSSGKFPRFVLYSAPLVALVAGIMIYSDPYYLYFTVGPLLVFVAWLRFRNVISNNQTLTAVGTTVLALIFAKLTKAISIAAGIRIVTAYPVQFVGFDQFFSKIALTIHSLLIIFGADFFGNNLISLNAASGLLNLLLLLVIITYIYTRYRGYVRSKFQVSNMSALWVLFFGGLGIEAIGLYAFSTVASDTTTYRYFIIFLYAGILLLALKTGAASKRFHYIISAVLVLATVGNLAISARTPQAHSAIQESSNGVTNQANGVNFAIIRSLEAEGVHKGYANYWQGIINTYLSNHKVNSLPTLCSQEKTYRFHWLIDENQFKIPARRSFYIHDPELTSPPACTLQQLREQFGKPSKVYMVADKTITIYNYDIGDKILD